MLGTKRRIHRDVSQGNLGSAKMRCENESDVHCKAQKHTMRRVSSVPALALHMAQRTGRSILGPRFSFLVNGGAEINQRDDAKNDDNQNQEHIVRPLNGMSAGHQHHVPELPVREGPVDYFSEVECSPECHGQKTWMYPRNTSETNRQSASYPATFEKTRSLVLSKRDNRHRSRVPSELVPHSMRGVDRPLPALPASPSQSGMPTRSTSQTSSTATSPVQWQRTFTAAPAGVPYLPEQGSEIERQALRGTRSAGGRRSRTDSQSARHIDSTRRNDIHLRQRHRFSEDVFSEHFYVDPLSPYPPGLETALDYSHFSSSYPGRHRTIKYGRSLACRSNEYQSDPLLMAASSRRSETMGQIVQPSTYIEKGRAGSWSAQKPIYGAGGKRGGLSIHGDTAARNEWPNDSAEPCTSNAPAGPSSRGVSIQAVNYPIVTPATGGESASFLTRRHDSAIEEDSASGSEVPEELSTQEDYHQTSHGGNMFGANKVCNGRADSPTLGSATITSSPDSHSRGSSYTSSSYITITSVPNDSPRKSDRSGAAPTASLKRAARRDRSPWIRIVPARTSTSPILSATEIRSSVKFHS